MTFARVDANQVEIVSALRKIGCFVQSLAEIGKGCPDLLCALRGKWYVLELKDGAKPLSARRLTPDEVKWHQAALQCGPVHVVESVEQAIQIITKGE
jgi:hypothetical protein